jgi:predicted DNA-binding transcriptional regulator AlpA
LPELNRIIRGFKLREYTGLGPTQTETLISEGDFPSPIALTDAGRAKGWLESELIEWQAYRLAKRDGTTACKTWAEYRDAARRVAP